MLNPEEFIKFEQEIKLSHVSFMDAYIPSTGIINVSMPVDLRKAHKEKTK